MTENNLASARQAAQTSWEQARASSDSAGAVPVAETTRNPQLLRQLYRDQKGPGKHRTIRTYVILGRASCPADIIVENAEQNIRAALHPTCPPELAHEALRRHIADDGYVPDEEPIGHLPHETLLMLLDSTARHADDESAARLADRIALASAGIVSEHAGADVMRWLHSRHDTHPPHRPGVLMEILGRDDLTAGERQYAQRWLLGRPSGTMYTHVAERRPLDVNDTLDIIEFAASRLDGRWSGGQLLAALLDRLDHDQQEMVLRAAAERRLLGSRDNDELHMLFVDASAHEVTLRELFADLPAEQTAHWDSSEQLTSQTTALLQLRTSAPTPLSQLSQEQLAMFEQLAPRWTGTFGALLDVIDRTS